MWDVLWWSWEVKSLDLTIFKGADFDKSGKDSLSSFFQHCVYIRNLHLSYFDFGLTMV
jgi:hypothetical protein